ncbi:MAG: hypothetical protein K6G42_04000 [Lachnospiraceae bacterium]|nr:hypothetical protein [Lachnospiraceae bacterium]
MRKLKTAGMIIVLMLALQLAGCGGAKASDPPDDDVLKEDIQEYIQEIIDESGSVKIFENTESNVNGDEAVAVCSVLFSTAEGDQQGEFTLTYSRDGGEWDLEKCKVELSDETEAAKEEKEEKDTTVSTDETADEESGDEKANEADAEEVSEVGGEASATETSDGTGGSIPSTGQSGVVNGYTLEETGSFSDVKGVQQGNGAMYYPENDSVKLICTNGQTFKDSYAGYSGLGGGYFAVRGNSDGVNNTGLVTLEGEVLIPCEAAIIEWIRNNRNEDCGRYLRVVYGGEKTTDKEKAFFYTTDKRFSFQMEEGDTMYTGYARVYDVVKRQFVPGVQTDNPDSSDMRECGDHFIIQDKEDISYLYDENGKQLLQTTRISGVGNGYIIMYDEGLYKLYDETGEMLFSSEDSLFEVDSTTGYLKKSINSNYVLIDKNGEQVLPDMYKAIRSERNGIALVQALTGEQNLISVDGSVLLTSADNIADIRDWDNHSYSGYYYGKGDDGYTLAGPGGAIMSGLEETPQHCVVFRDSDALVINDKEFSLHLDNKNHRDLGLGLTSLKSDSTGKYGAFDLFTGKQLLDYEYDKIEGIYGYIYALKGDTWTIYKLNKQYY